MLPRVHREESRAEQLGEQGEILRRVLRAERAHLWIRSPNPDLGYEKPLDLTERGKYRLVIGSILTLADATHSLNGRPRHTFDLMTTSGETHRSVAMAS